MSHFLNRLPTKIGKPYTSNVGSCRKRAEGVRMGTQPERKPYRGRRPKSAGHAHGHSRSAFRAVSARGTEAADSATDPLQIKLVLSHCRTPMQALPYTAGGMRSEAR